MGPSWAEQIRLYIPSTTDIGSEMIDPQGFSGEGSEVVQVSVKTSGP